MAANKLKAITAAAKKLYKTGRYKKWTDAIRAASKQIGATGGAKGGARHSDSKSHNVNIRVVSGIGATKIIQKGQSKNAKVTKVLQQVRTKKGTFRGYKRIGAVNDTKQLNTIAKENALKAAVVKILKGKIRDYDNNWQSLFEDILYHGLQSGVISQLIYYSDTTAWYKRYRKQIAALLKEMMWQTGAKNPTELFGNKWDETDPFADDTQNQNLLAWFSFEETTREIADRLGYEI